MKTVLILKEQPSQRINLKLKIFSMKASELRIGNYITSYETKDVAVYGVNEDIIQFKDEEGSVMYLETVCFEPILLTAEWLFKFGFEKDKEFFLRNYSRTEDDLSSWFMIHYEQKMEMFICTVGNNNTPDAVSVNGYTYVHQLQNLYFALTGEELTLKE